MTLLSPHKTNHFFFFTHFLVLSSLGSLATSLVIIIDFKGERDGDKEKKPVKQICFIFFFFGVFAETSKEKTISRFKGVQFDSLL